MTARKQYRVHVFSRGLNGELCNIGTVRCNATRDGLGVRFNGQARKVRRDSDLGASYIEWYGDLFRVQEVEE